MQLEPGCSRSHHTCKLEQISKRTNALAAKTFPCLTLSESLRPNGRVFDLWVEPRDLNFGFGNLPTIFYPFVNILQTKRGLDQ